MNKPNLKRVILLILIFCAALGQYTIAQDNNSGNPVFDTKTKTQTVNKIAKMLKENYVFPEKAKTMGAYLKSQLSSGAYENITEPMKFAETLTSDLQSISKDKHLRVRFSPEDAKRMLEEEKNGGDPGDEKQFNEMLKKENYGFRKVERLSGNIGYVDFRNFASPQYSKEVVADVMGFLSNTEAIIFDMRFNGGGDPAGVQLICSYLFGDTPVHLNDLYYRPSDETEEFWTLRKVDGKKMPDIPVYILTSSFTFSGAEEFTYNLKNLKRATIIGETTGGGAHPGGVNPVNKQFLIFIPVGRAISPITKTNWEGTGVTPDISVKSELALEQAQILALRKLSDNSKDQKQKKTFSWMIESLQAVMNAPVIDESVMRSYAGIYEDRTITLEGGKLYYQRKGRQKYQMTPMTDDTFMFKDIDYFRLKFVKDSAGNVTEVNGLYDDGSVDKSKKAN